MRVWRVVFILYVVLRYGLDELVLAHDRLGPLRRLSRALLFWRRFSTPRALRLRLALERLGPIFVKFGQALSTRRDLIPTDIADNWPAFRIRCRPSPEKKPSEFWKRSMDARYPRSLPNSMSNPLPALPWPKSILPFSRTAKKQRLKFCAPMWTASSGATSPSCSPWPDCSNTGSRRPGVCARWKWWPNFASICPTSWT
ncbi:hypothetical protein CARN8_410007 [mine drainage metagenome]|uniref:Ubiquinone biosynthesis protein UbiB n=1 Tax=mine drainage metagenome TaxID=410659 RepID=A0A3P3ZQ26_9ZZZZ